jgi:hypothetical protein
MINAPKFYTDPKNISVYINELVSYNYPPVIVDNENKEMTMKSNYGVA